MTEKQLIWEEDGDIWWGKSGELVLFAIQTPLFGAGFFLDVNFLINLTGQKPIRFDSLEEAKVVAQCYWGAFQENAGLI